MKTKLPPTTAVSLIAAGLSHGASNPIILIPGTTGSRLVHTETGRVVWGEFSRKVANGKTGPALRGIAFPMKQGLELSQLKDPVQSDGALEIIPVKLLPGITVRSPYYDRIIKSLQGIFSLERETGDATPCFVFDYHWRRSSDEIAVELERFIHRASLEVASNAPEAQRNPASIKFDLVTHSHGAVIARYYLMHGARLLSSDGRLPPGYLGRSFQGGSRSHDGTAQCGNLADDSGPYPRIWNSEGSHELAAEALQVMAGFYEYLDFHDEPRPD